MNDGPISVLLTSRSKGDETPRFEGLLFSKGNKLARVRNAGTGGMCTFDWIDPYNKKWAEDNFLPLMVKYAILDYPEFEDLFRCHPYEALSLLILAFVDKKQAKGA